jgi:hypothetical protein
MTSPVKDLAAAVDAAVATGKNAQRTSETSPHQSGVLVKEELLKADSNYEHGFSKKKKLFREGGPAPSEDEVRQRRRSSVLAEGEMEKLRANNYGEQFKSTRDAFDNGDAIYSGKEAATSNSAAPTSPLKEEERPATRQVSGKNSAPEKATANAAMKTDSTAVKDDSTMYAIVAAVLLLAILYQSCCS